MSQSDKDQLRKMLADLFAEPEQAVPPGNPVADYLGDRSALKSVEAAAMGGAGGATAGAGLGAMATGNIPLGLLMLLSGGASGLGAGLAANQAGRYAEGSNMWANRFGNNDPNQGMPGTPSGPAWRRK